MKKSIWVLTAIAAVLVLGVALMEFRERGFLSSYAAPPEKPAPLQTAGQTQTYNFDSDKTGDIPAGFHGARTGQGTEGKWVVTRVPSEGCEQLLHRPRERLRGQLSAVPRRKRQPPTIRGCQFQGHFRRVARA